MKKSLTSAVVSIMILLSTIGTMHAGGVSEHQRAKTAEKYFLAKQYEKAAPLYAQLVSSNPKNFKYNYYYGICMLIIGKDKNQAMPYLEMAIQHPKTPEEIYYYIGRGLHYTYRFDEAIRAFTEFNQIIGVKNAGKWGTPQLMEMCNNAKQYLDTTKLSSVTEKNESQANEFYNKYAFNNPNGKLLSMPDEIIKNSNSQKDERPTIFLSANGQVMYYSAISQETGSRDIYRVEKDLEGNWTEPRCLDRMVNSTQDELFPTCNSDGRILYFSSRGHSSTGGFDLFKCYYNTVSKTWTKPENMGSPYNSPDDDFCFVASTQEQTAYFTSQRETGPGTFTVYKVPYSNTEELPIAINGKFNCVDQPNLKSIHLIITRDSETNIIADMMTDSVTGAYVVELPGPGTYSFKIEASGYQTHTEEIRFGEFSDRIYVQDIFLSKSLNGVEDMAVSNRRLTESGLIDESLMVSMNEEEEGSNPAVFSAAQMAAMKASGLNPEINANNAGHKLNGGSDHTTSNDTDKNTILQDKTSTVDGRSILFKVQIGAFRKNTKEIVQKRLEKKTDKTMLTSYDDLTWLRFFIGAESNYKSAKNLRETLIQAGFSDAFIVAFNQARPMKLSEAIKTTKLTSAVASDTND